VRNDTGEGEMEYFGWEGFERDFEETSKVFYFRVASSSD
jgi:hypothetical protein